MTNFTQQCLAPWTINAQVPIIVSDWQLWCQRFESENHFIIQFRGVLSIILSMRIVTWTKVINCIDGLINSKIWKTIIFLHLPSSHTITPTSTKKNPQRKKMITWSCLYTVNISLQSQTFRTKIMEKIWNCLLPYFGFKITVAETWVISQPWCEISPALHTQKHR